MPVRVFQSTQSSQIEWMCEIELGWVVPGERQTVVGKVALFEEPVRSYGPVLGHREERVREAEGPVADVHEGASASARARHVGTRARRVARTISPK